jgi:hypothetical protein
MSINTKNSIVNSTTLSTRDYYERNKLSTTQEFCNSNEEANTNEETGK